MTARRTFQVVLTGTIPPGMTLAQARYAVWNQNLDLEIDVSEFDTKRDVMKMRLGSARRTRKEVWS
jgi:hypothetical protein